MDGWICGLMPKGKREYHLNGVKYIVSARFENPDSLTFLPLLLNIGLVLFDSSYFC